MKITRVQVTLAALGFRNSIFTEIETDAGITGISETVFKRRSWTIKAYIEEVSQHLIGRNPLAIEDIWEKLYRDSFWVGGPMHTTALSAVEIALWDIMGKELGAPIYRLLGGPTRESIPLYCHCASGDSPETFADNIKSCEEQGFRAVKTTLPIFYGKAADVPIGDSNGSVPFGYSGTRGRIDASHKETEYLPTAIFQEIAAYFAAARDAVGMDVEIAVDCHGRLSPSNALRLSEALAPYNLLFLEEPTPPESPADLAYVRNRSCIPIAAGERLATIYDARKMLEVNAVDLLQPDVVNCGGISQAKKIAGIAESHYIGIAPHNPNGPIATLTSAHLAASIPNFNILETIGSADDLALFSEVINPPLDIQNGQLHLSNKPGLGIELNHDKLSELTPQRFQGFR